jgi:hypothetical protein
VEFFVLVGYKSWIIMSCMYHKLEYKQAHLEEDRLLVFRIQLGKKLENCFCLSHIKYDIFPYILK